MSGCVEGILAEVEVLPLSPEDAAERYDLTTGSLGWRGYRSVHLIDGDLEFEGDASEIAELMGLRDPRDLLIIDGDAKIAGTVNLKASLYVTGGLTCEVLQGSYDQMLVIGGDAEIEAAILAQCQDASIEIRGQCYVPYVVENGDHPIEATMAVPTRWIRVTEHDRSALTSLLNEWGVDLGPDYGSGPEDLEWKLIAHVLNSG